MGTVRNKLLGVFLIVLLFIAAIGWNGISKIQQVQKGSAEVANKWMYQLETINTVSQFVEQFQSTAYQLQLAKTEDEKKQLDTTRATLIQNIEQSMAQYQVKIADDSDQSIFDSLSNNWQLFKTRYDKIAQTEAGSEAEAKATQDAMTYFNNLRSNLKMIVLFDHTGAMNSTQQAKRLYESALRNFILLGGAALVLIGAIAYLLIRHITKPLRAASEALGRIASGDLRLPPLAVRRKDEFGSVMRAVNAVLSQLQESVRQMQATSNAVASSSLQLSERALTNAESARRVKESFLLVSEGSEQQAGYAAECGRVIDDMAAGVQRIAENTSEVAELSKEAADSAGAGSGIMQDVSSKMEGLVRSLEAAEVTIRRLEQRSDQIGAITSLIGEIATQTNLLSLNAAIEAARAGEHGRGFAVVAEEVRKLAAQSEESSHRIAERIQAIQQDTSAVAGEMAEHVAQIRSSADSVKKAEEVFAGITRQAVNVSLRLQETAAAAEQLSASSEEVAASVENMGHLAVRTAGTAQQVAASTEEQLVSSEDIRISSGELAGIAERLQSAVNEFRLPGEEAEGPAGPAPTADGLEEPAVKPEEAPIEEANLA